MIFLVLATLLFGIALFLIKLSAPAISPYVGNIIFSISTLVVQLIVFFSVKMKGMPLHVSQRGIIITAIGGAIIGLYTVFLFVTFSKFDIVKASPVVYAGAISISSLLGIFVLGEAISWVNALGFLLVLGGIFLVFVK